MDMDGVITIITFIGPLRMHIHQSNNVEFVIQIIRFVALHPGTIHGLSSRSREGPSNDQLLDRAQVNRWTGLRSADGLDSGRPMNRPMAAQRTHSAAAPARAKGASQMSDARLCCHGIRGPVRSAVSTAI